jgi:histidine triad (HIT) family protein
MLTAPRIEEFLLGEKTASLNSRWSIMSDPTGCPFCIREFKGSIVREDDLFVSFLPNLQLVRGHTLIIPKRHIEPPDTLTDSEAVAIMHEVERLRSRMLERLGKGVDFWQKSRPDVPEGFNGTKVDHIHFHILPSSPGSEIYDKGIVWTLDRFAEPIGEDIQETISWLRQ